MTITCKDVRKKLSEDLQLLENKAQCELVQEHLANCNVCSEFRHSLRLTIGCFKAYDAELPQDLHSLVLQRLHDEGLTTDIQEKENV